MSEESEEVKLIEKAYLKLTQGVYPEGSTKNEKRVIRKKANTLDVIDGVLHYKKKDGKRVRFVLDLKEREQIIKSCHAAPTSGHLGTKKTLARVTERFMWPGVSNQVYSMIDTCDACQKTNRKISIAAPELSPVPVVSPWHHIGIDFIGPLVPSTQGSKYILTVSDYFSKYVLAIPMEDKLASGVAAALFKIFMIFGLPRVITSDQGGEFRNGLDCELMALLDIDHRLTTPYHPQANGLVERFNQTVQNMLSKFIDEKKDNWQDYLDTCVYAYNTAKHESSKYSPFEVMFYRKAVLPVDFIGYSKQCFDEKLDGLCNTSHSQVTKARKKQLEDVKAKIVLAQSRQKEQYDRKHYKLEVYKVGSIVLKKDFLKKKRAHGKLDPKWVGPFVITKFLGRGLYTIELVEDRTKIISRVNGVHLKLYHQSSTSIENVHHTESSPQKFSHSTDEVLGGSIEDFKTSTPHKNDPSYSPVTSNTFLSASPIPLPPPPTSPISLSPASPIPLPPASPIPLPPASPIPPLPTSPTPLPSASPIPIPSASSDPLPTTSSFSLIPGPSTILSDTVKLVPPARISPQAVSDKVISMTVAAPLISKKRKAPMLHSTVQKYAKLSNGKSFVRKLMFDRRQENVNDTSKSNIIEVEKYVLKSNQNLNFWLPELKLTESDKELLLNPLGWLNDNIINATQQLLKKNCFEISGFQDVVCGVAMSFSVEPDEFIQIVNNRNGHWLTISTVGCQHPTVSVYDSMYRSSGRHVNNQVASLLHSDAPKIHLNIMDSQVQAGGSDCGLFAVANATALVYQKDPGKMFFDQKQMRLHLYQCLEKGKITLFPVKRERRALTKVFTVESFEIHCICRLPEGVFPYEKWGKCSNCLKWYHTNGCLKVSKLELKGKWLCPDCTVQTEL